MFRRHDAEFDVNKRLRELKDSTRRAKLLETYLLKNEIQKVEDLKEKWKELAKLSAMELLSRVKDYKLESETDEEFMMRVYKVPSFLFHQE